MHRPVMMKPVSKSKPKPESEAKVTATDLRSHARANHTATTTNEVHEGLESTSYSGAWSLGISDGFNLSSAARQPFFVRDCPPDALPIATAGQQSCDAILRAVAKLPNATEFLSNLFANSPVGLCVLKMDGHVLFANQTVADIFGLVPNPKYNIFTDSIFEQLGLAAAVRKAFAGQALLLPTFWYDARELKDFPVTEGHRVAISVWMYPLFNSLGQVEHVAAIYRDDTQMMRTQEQLKSQSEQLEQHILSRTAELEEANEELEAFTYSVSHDLRVPLRTIDAFANLIAEDSTTQMSAQSQDYVSRIRSATQRMTDLIADLLAFSRLGKQALQLKPAAPQVIVSEVLQELEARLRHRNVTIHVGTLPACQADTTLLREVFLNLIDNAIKFTSTRAQAEIFIDAREVDGRIVWSIGDNGVGFDMAHYSRLFGVFSRLHTVEEFEGTGVGLALVRRIIKRHGGDIWAHAEPDRGATFYFTLGE